MADQVVPVTGLDTIGLIEDVPPVSLPPAAFSDCRNVRFRDGAVHKTGGEINILPYVQFRAPTDVLQYVVWWPNPNLSAFNLGYYVLIVTQGATDNIYVVKVDEAGTFDSPLILSPSATANYKGTFISGGNYQHTFFQGGFALVINNGLQTPQYVLDSEDNTVTMSVPQFSVLPGWDSYATTTTATRIQAFTGDGTTTAFSLTEGGASSGDTFSNLIVTIGDMVQAASTYSISNNVVTFNTAPAAGAFTITFTVILVANTVTAGVVRTYGDFLIAGNLVERDDQNDIIRALPNIIRSSDVAEPGAIPQNWNPFATGVNTADEFVVTGDGIIMDFVELQGNMYVYSNSSISVISRTGNLVTPLSVRPVTSAYGALTTDSVIEFDGRHFVVGSQDIYIFAGHPGSISSLADNKVRHGFYNRLNTLNVDGVFVLRYPQEDEIWICYSTRSHPGDRANEALIWNYRNQTWTKRDLQGVVSGVVGPVPGGGLPRDELGFINSNPTANSGITGTTHINQMVPTGNINMMGAGVAHQFSIAVPDSLPAHKSTGNPTFKITLEEDFYTGGGDCPPLRFVARAVSQTDSTDVYLNVNIPLQEYVGITEGSTIVYNTAEYLDQVTDEITDHLIEDPSIGTTATDILRIYRPSDEVEAPIDSNVTFLIEFQNISDNQAMPMATNNFIATIDIYKERPIDSEDDLALDDRPQLGDDSADNSIDRDGRELGDQNSNDGEVFSFGFTGLISNLSNYVFFYKGAANIASPGESVTYADLPSGFTIESGDRTNTGTGNLFNPSNPPAGADSNADGDDRFMTSFDTFETGPLLGSRILEILDGDTELDLRIDYNEPRSQSFSGNGSISAFALTVGGTGATTIISNIVVTVDGTVISSSGYKVNNNAITISTIPPTGTDNVVIRFDAHVPQTVLNLIAYEIPKESNGTADYDVEGTTGSSDDAATLIFNISEAVFDKASNTWVSNNVELSNITTLLHYNGDETSINFRPAQRAAYRQAILTTFANTELFTASLAAGVNGVITVTAASALPYIVSVSIEGGELLGSTNAPVITSFNFDPVVTQGYRNFSNASTLPAGTSLVVPPCVRIVHNDPDIPFFDFDTGEIQLVRERGNNTALTPQDWMGLINDAIQAAVPGQWSYNYNSGSPQWTSTAVRYDRAVNGDTVPYPNPDGTYDFPANRVHSVFTIAGITNGASNTITLTSTINQQGIYPNLVLGSHMAMRLNNNTVYTFYIGAHTNAMLSAFLQTEIERRIPELQVLVGTGGITIQPSVIGENSVFVEERIVNTEANITRFRELLNPSVFTQDTENPEVIRQLPEDVITPAGIGPFPSAVGPDLTGTPSTTFDLIRTWAEDQVNFSVEFPIFAAGRDNRDGSTSNMVLASDLGYSVPNFAGGSTSYISYIERVQMGMSPEFDTESVKSLALWTDGGSVVDLAGNLRYNALQLDMSVTNNPGQAVDLDNNPQYTNMHYISEDYKMDTRLTGRFLNWRLSDESLNAPTVRNGKTFQRDTDWRVSGMQWKISPAGRR